MNRKCLYYFFLIYFLFQSIIYSQKYDFNWLIGYRDGPKRDSVIGNTMLNFNSSSGNLEFKFDKNKNISFDGGNAISLSDKDGNYLMSFNGYMIEDGFGNKVINSDSICYYDECWLTGQQSVIIPNLMNENEYYIMTVHMNVLDVNGEKLTFLKLGEKSPTQFSILSNKNVLVKDTLDSGRLTACKHANGRDWWIIAFKDSINVYYSILLDLNGPKVVSKIYIDSLKKTDGLGYSTFSSDGKYYANFMSEDNVDFPRRILDFYKFDRCNGI